MRHACKLKYYLGDKRKYDIIMDMKRNIISLFVLCGVLAACQPTSAPTEYVEYAEYSDELQYQPAVMPYDDTPSASEVKYSVPRDGDLVLETRHHIIQIQGAPNTAYEYRVWAGDKTYAHDPDLIVDDGNIMVLQSAE